MSSRIWLINLVMAVFVIFFGIKALGVLSRANKWPSEIGSIQKPLPLPDKKVATRNTPPESDYEVVVNYNLFSDDRSEPKPKEAKKPEGAGIEPKAQGTSLKVLEVAHKRTHLYGVIIVDDRREAFIGEVPGNLGTSAGERGVIRAKVGDTVGRFKVKEIKDTSVLLTAGGYEWPVVLFDKDKPKMRAIVKKAGPLVVGEAQEAKREGTSGEIKEKKGLPVPATSKKDIFKKGQDSKKNLPVPEDPGQTKGK
ncbi:MAG: hypothetical protein KKG10_05040, partial [Proteobacteria bacterium]|nr:hypothetical protein [Pseudomonadota bacterium]